MTQSLALETARYVTSALRNNEPGTAERAVRGEGNGLTKPQQDAILALIQKRGEESNNALDRVRIDNEIWGVVNPATSQFMKTPRALANVFLCCTQYKIHFNDPISINPTRAFLVHDISNDLVEVIPKERRESEIRVMKDKIILELYEFIRDIERYKITYEQGMSYFPNLQILYFTNSTPSNMNELALAIQAKCPHFTTIGIDGRFIAHDVLPFKEFAQEVFLGITRFNAEDVTQTLGSFRRLESLVFDNCSLALLQAVAKLPIKRLNVRNWNINNCPLQTQASLLKNSQLEALTIEGIESISDIPDEVIEDLKGIKTLRYLVFKGYAWKSSLLTLAKIPQLKILDIRDTRGLELQQIIDLLEANKNIQHIVVSSKYVSEISMGQDVSQILTQYPQIIVDDSPWDTFDKKLLEQTRSTP